MPSWSDCRSGYFHGYACDMGPYIGPWPLMPTGVVAGLDPTYGDEIDFVLGLPNPADPSDPTIAFNGSYAAQVWTAYRFVRSDFPPGGSREGWLTDGTGGAVAPDGTAAPPPGVHLYVVGKTHTTPPPNAPDSYVPPSYAVGGTATVQTVQGGWSGWQDSFDLSGTTLPSGSHTDSSGNRIYQSQVSGTAAVADSLMDALESVDNPAATGGGPGESQLYVAASHGPVDLLHPEGTTDGAITAFQETGNYEASPNQPRPAGYFNSHTEGVDYGFRPFGDEWDYEDPTYSNFAWGPFLFAAGGQYDVAHSTEMVGGVHATIRVDFLSTAVAAGSDFVTDGTEFASFEVSVDDGGMLDRSLTLPDGLGTTFHISFMPLVVYPGMPVSSAMAPDPTLLVGTSNGYIWTANLIFGTLYADLDYTWSTGRWRYWLANPIVPVLNWHTAGGHWATPGGSTMRIMTPGVGWVDVVDGLG